MDFNRPIMEEDDRPSSSRASSSKSGTNITPVPDTRVIKSAEHEHEDGAEQEQVHVEENLTLEENNESVQNDTINESVTEPAHDNENEAKKQTEEQEVVVHKRETVKRKTRQQNKFADGNLILEEEDDMGNVKDIPKSPGPPPLDPISQIYDQDHDKQ